MLRQIPETAKQSRTADHGRDISKSPVQVQYLGGGFGVHGDFCV